jgi:hypothetical protein
MPRAAVADARVESAGTDGGVIGCDGAFERRGVQAQMRGEFRERRIFASRR